MTLPFKMDQKSIANLINTVKIIRSTQKALESKVDSLEEIFKNLQGTLAKDETQEDILVSEKNQVNDLIRKIDIKLNKFESDIKKSVGKH